MDTHLDWVIAAQEIMLSAGPEGADLMGVSAGGALAAEVAALWPSMVRRLVLGAPFGLFDETEPVADLFAQAPGALASLTCNDPARFHAALTAPEGVDESEWHIEQVRAAEAVARFLWPLGNTGLEKRLGRITQRVLLLWGEGDRIIPPSYAQRFADGIAGECTVRILPGAGHLMHFDLPEEVSREVLAFLG